MSETPSQQRALRELESYLEELTSTSFGRRRFLAAVPLLLAGCATVEQTRYREGDNTGQDSISVADERRLTAEALNEMRKDYPPVQDQELQAYVSRLGQKIVTASQLQGNPYQYSFTVVDVPSVNAFALPAGTVYVTAPLLAMAESEAELAGVVGHEIGHVRARHAAERMVKAEREKGKSIGLLAGGGLLGAAAGFGLGKLICAPRDTKCLTQTTALGAAAGAGGGLLIQKYQFMANSREDEMEADRIGFRTSVAAGYSKDHVGAFYNKLQKMQEQSESKKVPLLSSIGDALSTHPPSHERVAQMRQLAAEARPSAKAVVSTQAFDRARQKAEVLARRAQSKA